MRPSAVVRAQVLGGSMLLVNPASGWDRRVSPSVGARVLEESDATRKFRSRGKPAPRAGRISRFTHASTMRRNLPENASGGVARRNFFGMRKHR